MPSGGSGSRLQRCRARGYCEQRKGEWNLDPSREGRHNGDGRPADGPDDRAFPRDSADDGRWPVDAAADVRGTGRDRCSTAARGRRDGRSRTECRSRDRGKNADAERFPARRPSRPHAGLDNGRRSCQATARCWAGLLMVERRAFGIPAVGSVGIPLLPPVAGNLHQIVRGIAPSARMILSLAFRRVFRKLRFQMIDDI